jgi:hypothetical protein
MWISAFNFVYFETMAKLTQNQLLEIFNALKQEMKPYEHGYIKARMDIEGRYELVSVKAGIVVMSKPHAGMDFATIIIQSSYVGFYYMPIYGNAAIRTKLSEPFLKLLKGKACFHIKAANDEVLRDVRQAMKAGFECYEKMGWV